MEAATHRPEGQADAAANPFAALFNPPGQQAGQQAPPPTAADGGVGPNAAPLPNPWGPPCESLLWSLPPEALKSVFAYRC